MEALFEFVDWQYYLLMWVNERVMTNDLGRQIVLLEMHHDNVSELLHFDWVLEYLQDLRVVHMHFN